MLTEVLGRLGRARSQSLCRENVDDAGFPLHSG